MSSSTVDIAPAKRLSKQPLPWSLWLRQIRAIFRLEIEKNFLGRRSILLYLLALAADRSAGLAGAVYTARATSGKTSRSTT